MQITKSAADSEYQNLMQKLASVVFGKNAHLSISFKSVGGLY